MIGIRSAISIRARGQWPLLEAVYMTAPRSVRRNTKKPLPRGGRPYMTEYAVRESSLQLSPPSSWRTPGPIPRNLAVAFGGSCLRRFPGVMGPGLGFHQDDEQASLSIPPRPKNPAVAGTCRPVTKLSHRKTRQGLAYRSHRILYLQGDHRCAASSCCCPQVF